MNDPTRVCKLRVAKWVFATIMLVSLAFSFLILENRGTQEIANVIATLSLFGFIVADGMRVNRTCPREE